MRRKAAIIPLSFTGEDKIWSDWRSALKANSPAEPRKDPSLQSSISGFVMTFHSPLRRDLGFENLAASHRVIRDPLRRTGDEHCGQ